MWDHKTCLESFVPDEEDARKRLCHGTVVVVFLHYNVEHGKYKITSIFQMVSTGTWRFLSKLQEIRTAGPIHHERKYRWNNFVKKWRLFDQFHLNVSGSWILLHLQHRQFRGHCRYENTQAPFGVKWAQNRVPHGSHRQNSSWRKSEWKRFHLHRAFSSYIFCPFSGRHVNQVRRQTSSFRNRTSAPGARRWLQVCP